MKNKLITLIFIFASALVSGYILYELLKKLGLNDAFDFNFVEDIDDEDF